MTRVGIVLLSILSSVIVSDALGADTRFLTFPLRGKDPYSAVINSIFDHSMTTTYRSDGTVMAMTGDVGTIRHHIEDLPCRKDKMGVPYLRPPTDGLLPNYKGARECGGNAYLSYDGHPGYDYRTTDQSETGALCPSGTECNKSGDKAGQTAVIAAASGKVVCISPEAKCTEGRNSGEVKIDHENGYSTIYLHLSEIYVRANDRVLGGNTVLGRSGKKNATFPHLHFEVRKGGVPVDPYGWHSTKSDPRRASTGIQNIDLWLVPKAGCGEYWPGYLVPRSTDQITQNRINTTEFDSAWQYYTTNNYSLVKFNVEVIGGQYYLKPQWRTPRPAYWYAWWGVDQASLDSKCAELAALGLKLVSLERFVIGGAEKFAATWAK